MTPDEYLEHCIDRDPLQGVNIGKKGTWEKATSENIYLFPLPREEEQLHVPVNPQQCRDCGQTAMNWYDRCADCQTEMEVGIGVWDRKELRGTTHPVPRRPDRVLGDWVMRPCGTIADRGIR